MQPTNLYEYYTGQGKALPSVAERAPLATAAGIAGYTGTAEQNATLLRHLQAQDALRSKTESVITSDPANERMRKIQEGIDNYNINSLPDMNGFRSAETKKKADELKVNDQALGSAYDTYKAAVDTINRGVLSPGNQKIIDNLKMTFDETKKLQQIANENYTGGVRTLGIRQGRNRYATEIDQANIQDSIDEGIAKLKEIDIKEAAAVSDMTQALLAQEYKRASEVYDNFKKFIDEKNKTLIDIANLAREDQKLYLDQIKAFRTDLMNNYEYAVGQGYTGSLNDFQTEMKNTPTEIIKNYEYAKNQGYTGSFLQFKAAYQAAGQARASNTTVTSEDAARYGLPDSLVGKSTYSIIQDVSVSRPPEWFKQMLATQEPEKQFSPEGIQQIWNDYRSQPDLQVFTHLMDIDKVMSGAQAAEQDLLTSLN